MTAVSEFISHPKIDAHNHLNLGMRYASYVPWAGFYIPNFPRVLSGLPEMHEIIAQYTRPRCVDEKDVQDLISLAIKDAIADGVTVLEGSIDIGFVNQCGGIDPLLKLVEKIHSKFSSEINFKPELGMGKTFGIEKIQTWAPVLLESGLFKSIDLYGPEIEDGIEEFKNIYELAGKLGIKRKAHVGEFSDANSIRRLVEYFELEDVQHGIGAAKDDSVMQFLLDRNITLHVCPASNVMLSAVPSLDKHPIRKLYDAGLKVTIATDDLLFFNKSVSEQCADLVDVGMFTKEEIFSLMDKSLA